MHLNPSKFGGGSVGVPIVPGSPGVPGVPGGGILFVSLKDLRQENSTNKNCSTTSLFSTSFSNNLTYLCCRSLATE